MSAHAANMYQKYFSLAAAPFSIAPDPRYLYMSERHQEALATLLYGVGSDGGLVLLTGEVGCGKTTLCRCLLDQLPEGCDVAYIFNPRLTATELLSTICDEFGITYPPGTTSVKVFVDLINGYLLAAHARGRRAMLIIDEAQNLLPEVLEQMRLLTNLETSERKLLQIVLLGQPELVTLLARPELRQLAQRIIARYHLTPLGRREVAAYVQHRLEVAGAQWVLFPANLMGLLYRLSGGIPRVINVLCDRALLGAFVQRKQRVDRATLRGAAREVLAPPARRPWVHWGVAAGATLAVAGALVFARALAIVPAPTPARQSAAVVPAHRPPAAPAPAQQPLPATLVLPEHTLNEYSRQLAFATLFNTWHIVFHDRQDPCAQAAAQGMQCYAARAGLDELQKFNVPVILHMVDADGHPFYAALTRLDGHAAAFSFGAQIRNVSVDALARQWSGHFTMLLRMPRGAGKRIKDGARGAVPAWIGRQLARVEGAHSGPADTAFDDVLRNRLRQFQLSHGLTPDGIPGLKTLARLSLAADPSAPQLAGAGGRG